MCEKGMWNGGGAQRKEQGRFLKRTDRSVSLALDGAECAMPGGAGCSALTPFITVAVQYTACNMLPGRVWPMISLHSSIVDI